MQADIHPKYFDSVEIRCSCGNVIITGGTKEKMKTELCSNCHPFYTGQQKLVDTAGRVDKFEAKRKKAVEMLQEAKRKSEEKKKKPEVYKEKEIPVEVLEKSAAVSKDQTEAKGKWGKPLGETLSQEVAKEDIEKTKKPMKKVFAKPAVKSKAAVKKPAAKKTVKKTAKKK